MGPGLARATFVMSSLFVALVAEEIDKDPRITPLSTGYYPSTSSSTEGTEIASTTSTQNYEVTTKSDTGGTTNKTLTEKVTTSPVITTGNGRIRTADTTQADTAVDHSSPSSSETTHSTASWSSTSSSYYYSRTEIIEHFGNRRTDTEDFPDEACESEDGGQVLQQGKSYDIYKVDFSHDGWDENTTLEVTCQLKDKVHDKNCKGWVKSTVQNVSLEINGTRQDAEFSREYSSEENVMKFTDVLHYESHHKAEISCVLSLQSGAKLVSLNNTFHKVDELHNYTITPEKSHVTIGGSFALTCKTDSTRALNALRWKVKKNDEGLHVMINRDEKTVAGLNYNIHESVNNLHSVLNVATENMNGKFKSRIDNYTFYCTETFTFHLRQNLGEAKVTIHSGAKATGVSILVLTTILSVLF